MANNCYYELRAKGEPENLRELASILGAAGFGGSENTPYFSRVFDSNVVDEGTIDKGTITVVGDCAWSVYACMLPGEHAYYNRFKDSDKLVSNLLIETKRLGLVVEVYAEEYGYGFQEHIIVDNGNLKLNESVDAEEVYPEGRFDTLEEANEYVASVSKNAKGFTQEQFDNDECIVIGGYNEQKWIVTPSSNK